jgi:hypothetical protein
MRFQAGCGTISNRSTVHDRWGSPISTFIIVTDRVSASLARTASGSSSRVYTSANGMDAPRLRSLLLAESESRRHVTGKSVSRIALPHRSRVMQPNAQLDSTENRARKRNWSDRILGSARIQGVQRGYLPDVFLYVELFDFQIYRRTRNSEFGRSFSTAFRKGRLNEFLLVSLEGLCEKT